MNSRTVATSASGTGFVAGLVTIFVPLTHQIGHLTPGDIQSAVTAGVSLCIASLLGFLVHHGLLSVAEAKAGQSAIEQYLPTLEARLAALPAVQDGLREAKTLAADASQRVAAIEAKVPDGAALVADAEKSIEDLVNRFLADKFGLGNVPPVGSQPQAAPVAGVTVTPQAGAAS